MRHKKCLEINLLLNVHIVPILLMMEEKEGKLSMENKRFSVNSLEVVTRGNDRRTAKKRS